MLRKSYKLIFILLLLTMYSFPITGSSVSVGDQFVYVYEENINHIINGSQVIHFSRNIFKYYYILDYNATADLYTIRSIYIDYSTGDPKTLTYQFIGTLSYVHLGSVFYDNDHNNYYDDFRTGMYFSAPSYYNATALLDNLNETVVNVANTYSLTTLLYTHYNTLTGAFEAALKFPAQRNISINSETIVFTGFITVIFYVNLASDHTIEKIGVSYKGTLVSPTNGNFTYDYSKNTTRVTSSNTNTNTNTSGSTTGSGFNIEELFKGNTLFVMITIGIIGLVVGVAIGRRRKH